MGKKITLTLKVKTKFPIETDRSLGNQQEALDD